MARRQRGGRSIPARGALAVIPVALCVASLAAQRPPRLLAFEAAGQELQRLGDAPEPARVEAAIAAAMTAHDAMTPEDLSAPGAGASIRGAALALLNLSRVKEALGWLHALEARQLADSSTSAIERHAVSYLIAMGALRLGDFAQALARTDAVCQLMLPTLAADDTFALQARRQRVRANFGLGNYTAARAEQEAVVAAWRRRSDTPPTVLLENLNLLGRVLHRLGEREEAFEAFEECHAIAIRIWPDDHADVQVARQALGSAMAALGDYRGAYELDLKVLAVRERTLPPDAELLLSTKQNISQVLVQLGDLERAQRLQAEVIERLEAMSPRNAEMLVEGRQYLARIMLSQREYTKAHELATLVVDELASRRPNDDRDLNTARILLGVLERRRGNVELSRQLLEAAWSGLSRRLPIDHNWVQIAGADLITTCRLGGDRARAIELATTLNEAALASLDKALLASRPTGSLAAIQHMGIEHALSIALGDLPPSEQAPLTRLALRSSQLVRGIQSRVARNANRIRVRRAGEVQGIEQELATVVAELQRAPAVDGDRLGALVREQERLQRELLQLGRVAAAPSVPTLEQVAAALPDGAAAAAIVAFTRKSLDASADGGVVAHKWLAAIVLPRSGDVKLVDLGPYQEMVDRVDQLRLATHKNLRRAVLDPLLAAAGAEVIYLALDECLQLAPLESLPLPDGEPVGAKVELRRVTSLLDLVCDDMPGLGAAPSMVAVGGVDYGAATGDATPAAPGPLADAPATRGRERERFAPLPASTSEVAGAASAFRAAFPQGHFTVLVGRDATKERLQHAVRGAAVVHVASHGFFRADAPAAASAVPTLSPFLLCGLALTDANALGDGGGVLTGEELMQLDLTSCYLAVLSSCDSARGARSVGQGHASLHVALHSGGARFVISSLWQVDDRAAEQIMADFYRRLWQQPHAPHRALWQAKMAARANGLPFRDWAAFLVTGA